MAVLGVGTHKGAASAPNPRPPPPTPSLSLGDGIQPRGMCSCLWRGLAPRGPPSAPVPKAGTELPTRSQLSAAPGPEALPAGCH